MHAFLEALEEKHVSTLILYVLVNNLGSTFEHHLSMDMKKVKKVSIQFLKASVKIKKNVLSKISNKISAQRSESRPAQINLVQ
jgi:hypothetical protein